MLNSNERMGFIIEYMSSYDEKIKMANKNGLFDAAKMFELFAIEVCNVWFGQKSSNLNDETATYPYVDLISENRELLVQVSTVQDVPTKIKTTLEKIRDSKDKKCSDLKNIIFATYQYWQSLTEDDSMIFRLSSASLNGMTFTRQMRDTFANFDAGFCDGDLQKQKTSVAFIVGAIGTFYQEWTVYHACSSLEEAVELAYRMVTTGIGTVGKSK